MATTTNYSWVTPDDTSLVKDGAAAIRTLGSSIDTTVFNNANAAIAKTIVDAKGDIIAATAADTVSRLAVGANDTVLTADSSTATGLKWATVAAGGMTLISTTTLTGASVTLSSIPQTYTNLELHFRDFYAATAQTELRIAVNGAAQNCITTGVQSIAGTGSVYRASNYIIVATNVTDSDFNMGGFVKIYDYTNTIGKGFTVGSGFVGSSGPNDCAFSGGGGLYNFSSAITSLKIEFSSGNLGGGTVLLYGVK